MSRHEGPLRRHIYIYINLNLSTKLKIYICIYIYEDISEYVYMLCIVSKKHIQYIYIHVIYIYTNHIYIRSHTKIKRIANINIGSQPIAECPLSGGEPSLWQLNSRPILDSRYYNHYLQYMY